MRCYANARAVVALTNADEWVPVSERDDEGWKLNSLSAAENQRVREHRFAQRTRAPSVMLSFCKQ
jgi:hypothetical protein